MATPELIAEVYRLASVPFDSGTQVISDEELSALVDSKGVNGTVAYIWSQYASELTGLVDVTESGSSRKMSDLHKNALAMARMYSDLWKDEIVSVSARPTTRAIVRP